MTTHFGATPTSSLAPYAGAELEPGSALQDDTALNEWIRKSVATAFHPAGTCRMGPAGDPRVVVDSNLRVHGIQGLRVADASIMPVVVSANTNATTIMIGDRAADFILGCPPLPTQPASFWTHPAWQRQQR